MPLLDLDAFEQAISARGALLGIDPGSKRIGIAVCDPDRLIASPLLVIARARLSEDLGRLFSAGDSRAWVGCVVGLPLNMDGSAGPAAQSARAFARNLLSARDVPALLWDERLSTAAVTRQLIAADASRAQRAQVVDKLAAAYMLQGLIDRLQERKVARA